MMILKFKNLPNKPITFLQAFLQGLFFEINVNVLLIQHSLKKRPISWFLETPLIKSICFIMKLCPFQLFLLIWICMAQLLRIKEGILKVNLYTLGFINYSNALTP